MRKVSGASVAMILGVALYFTLFWGYDALRMLTSPTFGLEDVWRSQFVFGIGRLLGLEPIGLIKLAAFFAILKLTVAGICAVHILDRFHLLSRGKADSEVLEAGLILAMLVSLAAMAPAVWSHNADLVREQTIQGVLAGLAVTLCMVERSYARPAKDAEAVGVSAEAATPQGGRWFSPFR
jgi:uncharacterized YccA/Bax inhibitor family protein